MKTKKLLVTVISLVFALSLAIALTACEPADEPADNGKIALDAPEIALQGNVISWGAVQNADGYDIYENDEKVANQTETSYAITRTEIGEYTYYVKAVGSGDYTESAASNSVKYKVAAKEKLKAPVISIDENGIISWEAVVNATSYEIYENDVKLIDQTTTTYSITQAVPGKYSYKVKALSENFPTSDFSNEVEYTVPWRATVVVSFTEDFSGESVTVALYKGNDEVGSEEVTFTPNNIYGSVTFTVAEDNYTAKIKDLPEGYVATWAHITSEARQVTIIIAEDSGKTLQVGENTYTVADNTAIGTSETYVFTANKSGTFSLTTEEERDFTIAVNGSIKIDALQGKNIDTFAVENGETFIITISAAAVGEYKFNLYDYEVKQYIGISEGYGGNPVNIIRSDCKRYINIAEDGVYTIQFAAAAMGVAREITFTINGESYVFGGDSGEWFRDISFKAGTDIEIQITVKGGSGDDIPFYVFPKGAAQAE